MQGLRIENMMYILLKVLGKIAEQDAKYAVGDGLTKDSSKLTGECT